MDPLLLVFWECAEQRVLPLLAQPLSISYPKLYLLTLLPRDCRETWMHTPGASAILRVSECLRIDLRMASRLTLRFLLAALPVFEASELCDAGDHTVEPELAGKSEPW